MWKLVRYLRHNLRLISISVGNINVHWCMPRLLYTVNTTATVYVSSGEYEIHEMWTLLPTYNTGRVQYMVAVI